MRLSVQIAITITLILCPALGQAQSPPPLTTQGRGQTLELAPQQGQQLPPPSLPNQNDNTREIPVIPPNAQTLTLPQASTDFLGTWGGHLQLEHHYGDTEPPEETTVSILFGSQQGHVVLATYVYGSPDAQVLETRADSNGPREVTLVVRMMHLDRDPPVRHVDKLTMSLDGNDRITARKVTDFYVSSSQDPVVEAVYEGTLHPLTRAEERREADEIMRSGKVPRAHVQEGNPPPE